MQKNILKFFLTTFLLLFYIGIVMYVFFEIRNIDKMKNFETALVFTIIGFVMLGTRILTNICKPIIKIGFLVPMILTTIVYVVLLNAVNLYFVGMLSSGVFLLINLVLLFLYCLVSIPMFIMGKK